MAYKYKPVDKIRDKQLRELIQALYRGGKEFVEYTNPALDRLVDRIIAVEGKNANI